MRIIYFILFFANTIICQAVVPRILYNYDVNDNFYKSLFENLNDNNIDSIEIKLINWDNVDVDYCIKRASFEQTFAKFHSLKNEHNLVHVKILDKESISLFSLIINYTLIPFPKEGVIIYPDELIEMSPSNDGEVNIDPLKVRGKITFYTRNGNLINAFLSRTSIDICNYRYSLGETLSYFLSKLHQ